MKNLKILITVLLTIGLFFSCTTDDSKTNYHFELLKIDSAVLPDTLVLGHEHELKVLYHRPTTCHGFNGFYYDKNLNIRTVAVESIVVENNNCTELTDEVREATLNFYVTNNGSYVFKFWQGKDENGEDLFLEYEIPVKE
jgi:hypothetical protein